MTAAVTQEKWGIDPCSAYAQKKLVDKKENGFAVTIHMGH